MLHRTSRRTASYPIITGLAIALLAISLLSTKFAVSAQQSDACTSSYTVVPGDDLYQLSLRFGTTIAALQAANNIVDANLIFVGQVLCIPAATAPIGVPQQVVIVTVTPIAGGPVNINGNVTVVGDIGTEPPVDAIGNFLEVCSICSNKDINVTQRQYRQNTLVCASIKPVPVTKELGWYRVNSDWCSWYPSY